MTDPFFHTRAGEIIAAYGADPARWPDAERATALGVVAASPALRAAQAAAAVLDADLAAWATAPVAPGDAGVAAARATPRPRPYLRWAGGTGIAAAVAAGLVLLAPVHRPAPSAARVATLAAPAAGTYDAAAFAQVFTPTPDEEQVL